MKQFSWKIGLRSDGTKPLIVGAGVRGIHDSTRRAPAAAGSAAAATTRSAVAVARRAGATGASATATATATKAA